MGVRSAIGNTLVRVGKAFGSAQAEPAAMREAAEGPSQMGMDHAFAPGEPIGPFDGYSRTPRTQDYVTGYNIAARPRTHERVSFETLRGLIEAYDFSQICIWHRIDSLRSLDWKLIAADGYSGDITDAITAGMKALEQPDGVNDFEAWLAKWLYDVLAYDAGCLYRMRNRAGRCVGLKPIDGTLIAPLLDYWGDPPADPAEAYVQYVNGLPWNWLTRTDLIYKPYRPRTNSPYGHAPLESILLAANTDLRFQVYFLSRFTEGNIPAAFMSAPEGWSATEIEQFQGLWDAMLYGDQSRKSQIRWVPSGSKLAWSNEKDFSDVFSLFLMRKCGAAYHVVPSDLGFTEDVNRSSGESQADVQNRLGDRPLGRFVERVLTGWLQRDLGLPLKHTFDWGEEQDDRLDQARADQYYIDRAVVSPSEIRAMRYGLAEPAGSIVPRIFFTNREGPIPLSALDAVAGPTDVQTGAPDPNMPVSRKVYPGVEGVLSTPPMRLPSLSETEFGDAEMPVRPPEQPPFAEVTKDGESATTGITSETGVYGYDRPGHRKDDDEDEGAHVSEDEARAAVAKAELAAFRRFERGRLKSGAWRDFRFAAVPSVQAHNLNDAGRLAVRKAAGEIAVAGLAVLAADTGRVLMLQRALCDDDLAAGKFEVPGGHLADGEAPRQAAMREWQEESGLRFPYGEFTGSWTSPNGIYQGFVYTIACEADLDIFDRQLDSDPDGDVDGTETIAWWEPADLPGNPAIRAELLASLDDVLAALGVTVDEPVPA